ncbi:MAG: hypothetical protein GYB37_13075 [Algicola sp.]|nr:hypothetical protein [Algicola sp.]
MKRRETLKKGSMATLALTLPIPFSNNLNYTNMKENKLSGTEVIIVGAGPSGLAAALF